MPSNRVYPQVLSGNVSVEEISYWIGAVGVAIKHSVCFPWMIGIWNEMFPIKACCHVIFRQPSLATIFSLSNDTREKLGFLEINLYPWMLVIRAEMK